MDDIKCTACGFGVFVDVEEDFMHHLTVTIECDNTACGATWDRSGLPKRTPEQFRAEVEALARSWSRSVTPSE